MDEAAKRRLAGAAVLVALAVIFVPMLVDDEQPDGLGEPIVIPEKPDFDAQYDESVAPPEETPEMPAPEPEPPARTTSALPAPPPPDAGPAAAPDAGPAAAPEPPPAQQQATAPPAPKPQTPAPTPAPAAAAGPQPVPAGTRSWVVQVASLGSAESARGLQDRLRGKGYSAFVEQARVNGKLYYRVRVGPEIDRARADGIARKLADETGSKPLVQRYP